MKQGRETGAKCLRHKKKKAKEDARRTARRGLANGVGGKNMVRKKKKAETEWARTLVGPEYEEGNQTPWIGHSVSYHEKSKKEKEKGSKARPSGPTTTKKKKR